MAQYLLSVHHGDDFAMPEGVAPEDVFAAVDRFNDQLREAGRWVFAGGLTPASSATCVDATAEQPLVTDGPYLEAKEYLGGFWIITADDLDDALDWATRGSAACMGKVEVRAFQDEPEA